MPAPKTARSNKRLRASTIAARLGGMEGPSGRGTGARPVLGTLCPVWALLTKPGRTPTARPDVSGARRRTAEENPFHETRQTLYCPGPVPLPVPAPPLELPPVSTTPTRVFAARLAGLPVFDPQGDQVGKVRDVVVVMRPGASSLVSQPRVVGLVVEVFGRRQIFAPMTRITSIDAGQVITTGLLNMRRFAQRSTETLVIGQMLDRKVKVRSSGIEGVVFDVAMEQARTRDWVLSRVALTEGAKGF